jgi:hypothetical protein
MWKPAGRVFDQVKAEMDRLTSEFVRAVSFEPGEAPSYRSIPAVFIERDVLVRNVSSASETSSAEVH